MITAGEKTQKAQAWPALNDRGGRLDLSFLSS
jgi:hypothetical protein